MTADLGDAHLDVLVHEVRSPVAALAAVAETVAAGTADAATRSELVRLALAACRAIERIVVDRAVASVRLEPVDVIAVAQESAASFAVRGATVVTVVTQCDAGALLVDGDLVRLRQAVDNLIANALVHGTSTQEITVRTARSARGVEIAVSDAGPGIAPEDLDRVFEPRVRLDADRPGSGLGLALARAIAEAHGGTVIADSRLGEGSTFTIVLPAHAAQPATRVSRT